MNRLISLFYLVPEILKGMFPAKEKWSILESIIIERIITNEQRGIKSDLFLVMLLIDYIYLFHKEWIENLQRKIEGMLKVHKGKPFLNYTTSWDILQESFLRMLLEIRKWDYRTIHFTQFMLLCASSIIDSMAKSDYRHILPGKECKGSDLIIPVRDIKSFIRSRLLISPELNPLYTIEQNETVEGFISRLEPLVHQVMVCLTESMTNKEIAAKLNLEATDIDNIKKRLKRKAVKTFTV